MTDTISREEIVHLARLARLSLDETEIRLYQQQLSELIDYFKQLRELDLDNVSPTFQTVRLRNVLRDDQPAPSSEREDILKNAPESFDNLVQVPKII